MAFNNCNHHSTPIRLELVTGLAIISLLLILPYPSLCKSPLASIPTHHGINLDRLHLNERGGAVATRRWKQYYDTLPRSSSVGGDKDQQVNTSASTSVSTTSFALEPKVEKCKNTAAAVVAESTKAITVVPTTTAVKQPSQQHESGLSPTAITYMSLLALQFGIQPILVRKYTPQTIVRSSVVLVQELVKFGIAGAIYFSVTKKETREKDFEGWSVKTWIALAGLPAFLYTIQNLAALMAYQNLEALTFNVLNQTKILSAALSCYFVMGKRQSQIQVASLCVLIVSTLVIEQILHPGAVMSLMSGTALKGMSGAFSSIAGAGRRVTHGVVPILVASLISGMAGALTQKNLQGGSFGGRGELIWGKKKSRKTSTKASRSPTTTRPPRNAYLFSMEMNIASVILLLASLGMSSDGRNILQSRAFFDNWTLETWIPVITNSIGGILVGLVTKHAGSVRKGFALIFGLLLSGMFQASGTGIRTHQVVGGLLAATSLWMHTTHPYKHPPAKDEQK